ncbi:MAG: conjugal transfer protein, partial [Streptosporangiaceae bacterium]
MELPTYTSIWRIERRLYKLYDFRLPIPLPVGQITVFAGVCLPYVVILGLLGVPFSHTLFWLYVLPPGVLTWLVTRPVLQGKRLPELLRSQVRYLAEPRLLCRMAPFAERDVVVVTGRVWRGAPAARAARTKSVPQRRMSDRLLAGRRPGTAAVPDADVADPERGPAWLARAAEPARPSLPAPARIEPARIEPARIEPARIEPAAARIPAEAEPAWAAGPPTATFVDVDRGPRRPWVPGPMPSSRPAAARQAESGPQPGADRDPDSPDVPNAARAPEPPIGPRAERGPDPGRLRDADGMLEQAPARSAGGSGRRVVVTGQRTGGPISVGQALGGNAARRGQPPGGRVVVAPGGDRPGGQDQFQRDRARVRLPIGAARRVVVLGCTVGAGQTTTALFCAEVVASLRSDPVAVLDLNPGPAGLTALAAARPALSRA